MPEKPDLQAIRERAEKATTIPTKCDVDSEHNAAMLKFWLYDSVDRIAEFQSALARVTLERDRLQSALLHMGHCRSCAEGSWEDCEGGRAALEALSRLYQPQEKAK